MTVLFELSDEIKAPINRVFDLAASIDFHLESFKHSGERAVAGVTSGLIGLNETVTWKAKHFGITWKMTSRITELERPTKFTDEQDHGPFKTFRHVHLFTETPEGTQMVDQVSFQAPFGPIGTLVEKLMLNRYLRKLIQLRNDELKRAAETPAPGGSLGAGVTPES